VLVAIVFKLGIDIVDLGLSLRRVPQLSPKGALTTYLVVAAHQCSFEPDGGGGVAFSLAKLSNQRLTRNEHAMQTRAL